MAKPKAERWLTETFAAGAWERGGRTRFRRGRPAYRGANPACWLAEFDDRERPCRGDIQACHAIPRQRVEHALGALLPWPHEAFEAGDSGWTLPRPDLILIAAYDPRNAVLGCGGEHHPRFDNHATPPLVVPRAELPIHVEEFIADYGFNLAPWLIERFPP